MKYVVSLLVERGSMIPPLQLPSAYVRLLLFRSFFEATNREKNCWRYSGHAIKRKRFRVPDSRCSNSAILSLRLSHDRLYQSTLCFVNSLLFACAHVSPSLLHPCYPSITLLSLFFRLFQQSSTVFKSSTAADSQNDLYLPAKEKFIRPQTLFLNLPFFGGSRMGPIITYA